VKFAVVIPALDEADDIEHAVASASADTAEVWVVDGGSRDATRERARSGGARVLDSPRGRAIQLQAGFRASEGDVIVFLHADTRLPSGWQRAVATALGDPEVVGGAFRLRFDDRRVGMRIVEWAARLRIWLFCLPFGDQALFVRREVLEQIGGVPDVPVMEDLDLVVAMKARGRLALLSLPATTSNRRYRKAGIWRTSISHFLALVAWRLNVDRDRLAGWLGR
jgi:rSAM/selenodomain-associated transferase 2